MPMTAYWRKKLGDGSLNKAAFPTPANLYMGLFSANPTASGILTSELTFTGYARQEVTSKFGAFDLSTGIATSTSDVNFGVPGSDGNALAYVGFMDASTAGNMLFYEQTTLRAIVSGMRALRFRAGRLTIRFI